MNKLQYESSPYLLQHAHNPVDWFAWKPEAFEKALREDKPVLVSIGYSTCHWCHVMERESFEDPEVAEYMNEHFVCIKVDREERPDVDQIYMEACQVMTGGGGWPLNCFLTPEKKPFYAGTYYPPMPAYNRPSWLQVLMNISDAFQNKRQIVDEQAARLTEIIQKSGESFMGSKLQVVGRDNPFDDDLLHRIYQSLSRNLDQINGGFGGAPKFPGTMALHYLLNYGYCFKNEDALSHVGLSLDKMAMGGIYDQLGGGFARYSTDAKWLVPHFEKMLYDNALIVGLLSEMYKLKPKGLYKETIIETLDWVSREMSSREGGFFSAQDADSEGVEGKYYVWEKAEIERILGKDAHLFCEFYSVSETGNWEGKNILWRNKLAAEFAEGKGLDYGSFKNQLQISKQKLFSIRQGRVHPGLDDKILLDWNGLMCSAYAKAFSALGDERYRVMAVKNLSFLLDKMVQPDGITLFHTYKNGHAQYDAFLDDYANLIEALFDVYEITFDTSWLLQAKRYTRFVLDNFLDVKDKLFYFTSANQKDILLKRKDFYDSATPSGNATMVRNLQRASIILGVTAYRELATEMLLTVKGAIERYPSSFGRWATSLIAEVQGTPEIAVIGKQAEETGNSINKEFFPNKVLMASSSPNDQFQLLKGKTSDQNTLIFLCKDYACQKPVDSIEGLRQLLQKF